MLGRLATAGILSVTLLGAPSVLADVSISTNWSGYVAHRPGLKFHRSDMIGLSTPSGLRGGGSFAIDYSQVQASKLSLAAPAARRFGNGNRRTN